MRSVADELRAAFRRALRRTHPDLHGGDGEAVVAPRCCAAYELPSAAAGHRRPSSVTVDGDTVAAELPAGDLFDMLVEVGDRIGDVAYLDADAGLLEVRRAGAPATGPARWC